MKNDVNANPSSPISKLVHEIIEKKLPYIRHYIELDQKFGNSLDCFNFYLNEEKITMLNKIRTKGINDPDSILGTYFRINPLLESPSMYKSIECIESDRKTLTKYRTGSHSLKIQTGRKERIPRNQRLCKCGLCVQTIDHVLLHCELTKNILALNESQYNDIKSFFENKNYEQLAAILGDIEQVLNLKH